MSQPASPDASLEGHALPMIQPPKGSPAAQNSSLSLATPTAGGSENNTTGGKDPGLNLFVANLSADVNDELFANTFNPFGKILSAKVMLDIHSGISRGFGFVLFEKESEGMNALSELQGKPLGKKDNPMAITKAQTTGRSAVNETPKLHMRNVPKTVTEAQLQALLVQFGKPERIVMKEDLDNPATVPGGAGAKPATWKVFVQYSTAEEANSAVNNLHNSKPFPDMLIPLMAKPAETPEMRQQRKQRQETKKAEANVKRPIPTGVPPGMMPQANASASPNSMQLAPGMPMQNAMMGMQPGANPGMFTPPPPTGMFQMAPAGYVAAPMGTAGGVSSALGPPPPPPGPPPPGTGIPAGGLIPMQSPPPQMQQPNQPPAPQYVGPNGQPFVLVAPSSSQNNQQPLMMANGMAMNPARGAASMSDSQEFSLTNSMNWGVGAASGQVGGMMMLPNGQFVQAPPAATTFNLQPNNSASASGTPLPSAAPLQPLPQTQDGLVPVFSAPPPAANPSTSPGKILQPGEKSPLVTALDTFPANQKSPAAASALFEASGEGMDFSGSQTQGQQVLVTRSPQAPATQQQLNAVMASSQEGTMMAPPQMMTLGVNPHLAPQQTNQIGSPGQQQQASLQPPATNFMAPGSASMSPQQQPQFVMVTPQQLATMQQRPK